MFYSLKGAIVYIGKNYVAIDVRDVAYLVYVSKVEEFHLGEIVTLYTHYVVREDEQYIVGFLNPLEKEAFLSLIQVKGIGPRIALNALGATNPDLLLKAISSNNVAYLKKLPGIGAKAAAQIILDLKGTLAGGEKADVKRYDEVRDALKQLGFKVAQIDRVLADINEPDASMEEILAIALRMLKRK